MKGKEREKLKALSGVELESELRQAVDKHFRLRFKHRSAPLSNPLELRILRRKMAHLKTLIHQKAT
ncbi:MAG: 50S ribosomal protein L29 [Elusimicrobia bacterium]|nr:50S ribosomal protein L29 [Elusimicrobiota bacterium]